MEKKDPLNRFLVIYYKVITEMEIEKKTVVVFNDNLI